MSITADEIMNRIFAQLADWDTTVGSVTYDIIRPIAEEIALLYEEAEKTLDNAFISTASGEYLDKKAEEQGLFRHTAEQAVGELTFTGNVGAVIPALSKAASNELLFSTLEKAIIPSSGGETGTVTVPASCDTAGRVGNVSSGAVSRMPAAIAGVTAVVNSAPFTGGTDEEEDEALRSRLLQKVQQPHTGGNEADYIEWATDAGAGSAAVIPLWNGAGTVKVLIADENGRPAGSALVESVARYIETKRPVGADVTVVSFEALNLDISANLVLASGTLADAEADIEAAVGEYLKEITTPNVSRHRLQALILSSSYVQDYTSFAASDHDDAGNTDLVIGDKIPILYQLTLTDV